MIGLLHRPSQNRYQPKLPLKPVWRCGVWTVGVIYVWVGSYFVCEVMGLSLAICSRGREKKQIKLFWPRTRDKCARSGIDTQHSASYYHKFCMCWDHLFRVFENFRIRNVSAREILEKKGFDVVEFHRGTSRFVILSQCPWYRGVSCRVSDTMQSSIGEQMRRKVGEFYT